jgi:hypothetical protein
MDDIDDVEDVEDVEDSAVVTGWSWSDTCQLLLFLCAGRDPIPLNAYWRARSRGV